MKRFSFACLAALAVTVFAQQKASAWSSFNFSAGVNTSFQCGGFRLLWGLIETAPGPNSQFAPACSPFGNKGFNQYTPGCPQPCYGGFPAEYGMPGGTAYNTPYTMPYADNGTNAVAPAPKTGIQPIGWFYNYSQPYSGYQPNYYQAPSYWYNQ